MSRSTHLSPVSSVERRRRMARLRLGVSLVVFALAGMLVAGPIAPARAQESEGVPDDAKPLDVSKEAVYTHSLGNSAPPTLTDQFPPQAVCLVVPDFCTEQAEEFAAPVNNVLTGDPDDEADDGNQPEDQNAVVPATAPPGTLPVGVIAGGRRHESAIKFPTPSVGEDELVESFRVYLTQTDPSFTAGSPAFRQLIVGLLSLAREDSSEIPKTADKDLFDHETYNGVEACVITDAFEEGDRDGNEAPQEDADSDTPGLDCSRGANGKRIETDDGTVVWEFDLTLAANGWAEGTLVNEGILFRPVTPPNLAYGDPDLSTSEQVTFEGSSADDGVVPLFSLATAAKPDPVSFDLGSGARVQGAQAQTQTFSEVLGNAGASTPAPTVARAADPPAVAQAAPAVLTSNPVTQWWVWLLLPMLLAGAFLTSQALVAEPAIAVERSGAMSRLIEARRAARLEP